MGIFQLHYLLNTEALLKKLNNEKINHLIVKNTFDFNSLKEYDMKYIRRSDNKYWNNYFNLVNKKEVENYYTNGIKQKQYQHFLRNIELERCNSSFKKSMEKISFV